MKIPALCSTLLLMSGCSIAPLSTPNGGTTIGDGETRVSGNLSPAVAVNVTVGVSDNTDVGVTAEQQLGSSYAIWAKHSVLNETQGPALALLGGIFKGGSGASSEGFYLGPSVSYRSGKGELYSTARYNRVYWDGYNNSDDNDDELLSLFEINDEVFYYWQVDIGVNVHANRNSQFSVGASCIVLDGDSTCLPVLGAGFKL